jgi:hypothetical protein
MRLLVKKNVIRLADALSGMHISLSKPFTARPFGLWVLGTTGYSR